MKSVSDYCKNLNIANRVVYSHPQLLLILCDFILWCEKEKTAVVVTDSVSSFLEDEALSRVSSTHREGRAIDISTKGWSPDIKAKAIQYLKQKWKGYGALSPSSGKEVLAYVHNAGSGEHLHIQISKRYTITPKTFFHT